MRARPSLVALLALSRRIQVAAKRVGFVRLLSCQVWAAAGASKLLGCTGLRSGLPGLSVLRRPAHGRATSKPTYRSSIVPYRVSSVLRGRAAPRLRPVQAPPMQPRCARCYALPSKGNARSLLAEPWPNPSIERTAKSTLRVLSSAAHVKR